MDFFADYGFDRLHAALRRNTRRNGWGSKVSPSSSPCSSKCCAARRETCRGLLRVTSMRGWRDTSHSPQNSTELWESILPSANRRRRVRPARRLPSRCARQLAASIQHGVRNGCRGTRRAVPERDRREISVPRRRIVPESGGGLARGAKNRLRTCFRSARGGK